MAQPRALALAHIGTLASPMEKIRIARTHALTPRPAWLLPAYKAVCAAGAPPARHELEGLHALDMWGIWMVQHELAQGGRGREVRLRGAADGRDAVRSGRHASTSGQRRGPLVVEHSAY